MGQRDLALAGREVEREKSRVGPRRSFRGAPSRIEVLVHDQARRRGERHPEAKLTRRPAEKGRGARPATIDETLRAVPEPERARDGPIEPAVADRGSDSELGKEGQQS